MSAPTPYATNLASAYALAKAATHLFAMLERTGGQYSTNALHAELSLAKAVQEHFADADMQAAIDGLCDQTGTDADGNQLDDYGWAPERVSLGMAV